jgi:hypothetical protein
MKKIAIAVIAFTFIFFAANLSFAENEFQLKGIVIKINGNQLTIKDDKGKETTVEGNANDIKVGDPILLKGQIFKGGSLRTKLTTQDVEFLTKQCSIDRADVNVIPQLEEQARMNLFSWIDGKDCKLFREFKASRAYYKQLKPKARLPLPPAGWDTHYLTDAEFNKYSDIIANAPW